MQVTFVVSSLLLAAVAVSAYPAGQSPESRAVILVQDSAPSADGSLKNNFQTDNGIKQEEVRYLKAGPEGPVSVVQGAVSYVAPDGQTIQTGYVADENGYQPYGAHLPTPPAIPFEIQESLRYLASLPSTPEPKYQ
ncbi:endocuticle structural glycoprotein SgAbd-4-like [Myzus persicae]|uniref:Cuticle protein 4 n=1 Tax=Myzus persicae TaxID=13164 RepID=Q45V95_MYZPE|nr:endocuticle structural glycoprotein SgAbd-4-like [Myzus persicae]AAZ20450.1 RR1 cuticle protein 1 [Myzus persicae]ABB04279.1 cuticle protein 4 [Myzus persicae]AWF70756.1 stylin-001 [Myzus persicae]